MLDVFIFPSRGFASDVISSYRIIANWGQESLAYDKWILLKNELIF